MLLVTGQPGDAAGVMEVIHLCGAHWGFCGHSCGQLPGPEWHLSCLLAGAMCLSPAIRLVGLTSHTISRVPGDRGSELPRCHVYYILSEHVTERPGLYLFRGDEARIRGGHPCGHFCRQCVSDKNVIIIFSVGLSAGCRVCCLSLAW